MMQATWSLVLNAILLVGVIIAIVHTLKTKRENKPNIPSDNTPALVVPPTSDNDDIISVRKINLEPSLSAQPASPQPTISSDVPPISPAEPLSLKTVEKEKKATSRFEEALTLGPNLQAARSPISQAALHEVNLIDEKKPSPILTVAPVLQSRLTPMHEAKPHPTRPAAPVKERATSSLMILVSAKENREFAGYDLLQTILGAGLRFGDGQLFHRHQSHHGQGPVLCSLAAATKTGVFDMQNIGGFRVRGLCLFMQASGNSTIDAERFDMLLETAIKLSEDLDGILLDDRREPFSKMSRSRYDHLLLRETEPA